VSKESTGKRITDELRKFSPEINGYKLMRPCDEKELLAIADHIDAEHQKALDEWKAKHGQTWTWIEGYAECHTELMKGDETLAADLESCGWIRLPKDADGEYIHIGDVVDVMPTDKFTGHKNVVVTSVIFKRSVALVTVDTADRPFTFMPNRIRHHHAPTVEDVLREFADEVQRCCDTADTIAEYAAKLQLRGDAV
jgi:hypothetical protein